LSNEQEMYYCLCENWRKWKFFFVFGEIPHRNMRNNVKFLSNSTIDM
jgi:hypothetical protein